VCPSENTQWLSSLFCSAQQAMHSLVEVDEKKYLRSESLQSCLLETRTPKCLGKINMEDSTFITLPEKKNVSEDKAVPLSPEKNILLYDC
jgi:hypothetical protein